MKILFVAPLPPPFGGIANWTRLLVFYLEREKKEEIQFSLVDSSPKRWVTKETGFVKRALYGGLLMRKLLKEIRRKLNVTTYDVLHLTTSGSLGLIRDSFIMYFAKKNKVKVVYHLHFGRVPEILKKRGLETGFLKYNLRQAHHIIAIDKVTERSLKENGYLEKTVYVPNGIDLSELPKKPEVRRNIVTFAGWVIKEKGIRELISAWKELDKNLKRNWVLRMIGPFEENFIKSLEIEEEKDIVLMGRLSHEETLEKINEGKIFVLPSYSEGFPYSILEAMALEQSIIATDVGDMREMLSPDSGIMIQPKSVKELAMALQKVLRTQDSQLSLKAKKKVTNKYEISKIFEEYKKIYEA